MSQFLRPNEDWIVAAWMPEPSDTILWNVIDEVSANDADYMWQNAAAAEDAVGVHLSDVSTPNWGLGVVRWRQKRIEGAKTTYLKVVIYEGETARFQSTGRIVTDDWTDEAHVVSAAQMAVLSDWTTIRLKWVVSTSGGGKASDPAISWAEFEVPDSLTYKLEGITKDKNGSVLGSCLCFLCKDNQDNSCSYVAYVLSDSVTGAYSFTGIYDNDPQYYVISWKDNTPHVFDVTDHVLQPILE